jgi:hypothetical protein
MASIAMALSSISVVANALRLRRFRSAAGTTPSARASTRDPRRSWTFARS